MSFCFRFAVCAIAVVVQDLSGMADDIARVAIPSAGAIFETTDTLQCDVDATADAQECLTGLRWSPKKIAATC
jgi:hypothetical protein